MTTDQLTINASQSILVDLLNLRHLDINKAHTRRENTSRSRRMVLLTVVAEGVLNVQAPPATTFLHPRHFQIPAASRLTESLPQNYNQHVISILGRTAQLYFACWVTSDFLTCFRREAP